MSASRQGRFQRDHGQPTRDRAGHVDHSRSATRRAARSPRQPRRRSEEAEDGDRAEQDPGVDSRLFWDEQRSLVRSGGEPFDGIGPNLIVVLIEVYLARPASYPLQRLPGVVANEGIPIYELACHDASRRPHAVLTENGDRRRLLVRLAPRYGCDECKRLEISVKRYERCAIVALAPEALHGERKVFHALVGVTERAFERTIALDARLFGGRSDAVVSGQVVAETKILLGHVAVDAYRPRARRLVVRVGGQRGARVELVVTTETDTVARRRLNGGQLLGSICSMRIVAGHARHCVGAASQQKIARLAGANVTAAGVPASLTSFPGERVAREQDLVAPRADAVHGLCSGAAIGLPLPRRQPHREERASDLERRLPLDVEHMLAATAVARLTPDSHFD